MKDNPTFDAFQGQVSKYYDDIFVGVSKTEDKYGTISYDTYKALRDEILDMPTEEIETLPEELQLWIRQLPKRKKEAPPTTRDVREQIESITDE